MKTKDIVIEKEVSLSDTQENNSNLSSNEDKIEANQPIVNGLFVARYDGQNWFATVGKYKVSESYPNIDDLKLSFIQQPTWLQLSAIIAALQDSHDREIKQLVELINEKQ